MIHSINQDTRQPLIVLVTDGESTDLNAAQVKPQIKDSLAAVGADLLTVSVTSGKTRDERLSEHAQYLESMRFSRNDIDAIAGTKDSPTFVEDISSEYLEIDHIDDLSESLENLIERKTSCD